MSADPCPACGIPYGDLPVGHDLITPLDGSPQTCKVWPRPRYGAFSYAAVASLLPQSLVRAAHDAQVAAERAQVEAEILAAFRLKRWHVGLSPWPRMNLGEYHRRQQARVRRKR